ncbi:ankyrin repeat-containing domain protein [Tribonema minus]|uniref:Ankyrin repeat-containing domain protein n=1 Tax=Tribonema minus TaxID=303371 RepID=A0A836CKX6_9STRA|nr:ankyrin repeat-containing domain protein [Tribonema minus]
MPARSGRAFILQSWYDRAQSETHSQGPDSTLLALAAAGDVPRMLALLYPAADSEQTRGAGSELADSDHQHQRQPHHAAPPRRLQCMASSRSEPGRLCQLAHQGSHPRLSMRGQPSSYGGLDDRDADGNTPLMVALQHEQVRAACLLMQAGADVALLSDCGAGALLSACLVGGGSLMAVDMLLRKGAPVDPSPALVTVPGSEAGGITPLMCACIWGHGDVAAALIEHDASMLSIDADGRTALMHACLNKKEKAGLALLAACKRSDRCALAAQADAKGDTPLHAACALRLEALVNALLAADAPLSVVDSRGSTALAIATLVGAAGAVQALLEAGASGADGADLNFKSGRSSRMHSGSRSTRTSSKARSGG